MQRYFLVLLFFCLLCITALALLRPGPEVRFEAEVLRLSPEAGLALLDEDDAGQPRSANLDLLHARLALAANRAGQAAALYHGVLDRGPAAPPALLEELARTALVRGDARAATSFLRRAHDAEPTEQRRRVLGLHYRRLGDAEAETVLLQGVEVEVLKEAEFARLCELLIAARDIEGYERLLTEAAAIDGPKSIAPRAALVSLLVETGRSDAAIVALHGWLTETSDPVALARSALQTLLERGARDEATAFAHNAIGWRPELDAVMPGLFHASGYGGLARVLQARWLDAVETLDAGDWAALAEFGTLTGDLRGIHRALAAYPGAEVPADVFMVILRHQGIAGLAAYRDRVGAATIEAQPVLGAAIAAWSRSPETTYRLLKSAARSELSEWDRQIWAQVALSLKGSRWMTALASAPDLPPDYRALATQSFRGPASAGEGS